MKSLGSLFNRNHDPTEATDKINEIETTVTNIKSLVSQMREEDKALRQLIIQQLDDQTTYVDHMGTAIRNSIGTRT